MRCNPRKNGPQPAGSVALLYAPTDRLAGLCRLHAEEQAAAAAATKAAAQEAAAVRQSQQQEQAQATAAAERLAASRLQAETTADAAGRASHLPHVNGGVAGHGPDPDGIAQVRTKRLPRGRAFASPAEAEAPTFASSGKRHAVIGPVASIRVEIGACCALQPVGGRQRARDPFRRRLHGRGQAQGSTLVRRTTQRAASLRWRLKSSAVFVAGR